MRLTDSGIIEKVRKEVWGAIWMQMADEECTNDLTDEILKIFGKAIEADREEMREKIEAIEAYMFEDDWENDDFGSESCSMVKRAEVLAILGESK